MNKKKLSIIMSIFMISQSLAISSALDTDIVSESSDENSVEIEKIVNENDKNNVDKNNVDKKVDGSEITKKEKVTNFKKEDIHKSIDSDLKKFQNNDTIVKRISSSERVKTSVEISKFQNVTSKKVIIADSRNYPDALAAAGITDGKYPVLLVGNEITEELENEIRRLGTEEVIILGGKNSVSEYIENQLNSIGKLNVRRIGGVNRYETSKKIFEESKKEGVVLASGQNFPDALSASPLLTNSALLLTDKYSLSPELRETVKNIKDKNMQIVGGYGSISNSLEKQLMNIYDIASTDRISGVDRYATSVQVANRLQSDMAIIASGESFPDALAASTLAQMTKSPVLLVSKNRIDESVANYIKDKNIKKAIIVGGDKTIQGDVEKNIERLIEGKEMLQPDTPEPVESTYKNAVTKSSVNIYSDTNMTSSVGIIEAKKIVDVLEKNDSFTKIRYDRREGWVDNENLDEYDPVSFGKVVTSVPYISQLSPVYAPNGCEATSMLMGLQGKGYTNIGLKDFLNVMPKTDSNPANGYVGSPYGNENFRFLTIDPEPLAKYGQKYGNVVNIQGQPIDQIIKEIQNGNTVVAYMTLYWNKPQYKILPIDGVPTRRIFNNHVLLLTGYDPVKKSFYIADPYNHEKAGGNRKKAFYYWKSQADVDRCYNYDNRRFAVSIR
ncbi:MAG: cell wall-binding repeat-containing protein [Peptostreptococcus sp.]|uniref:cell wall-binding repeat-containing protein n=1 Tax=Peptostreptococcus sp. TaxID=1262 RepID=UPI002FC662AC